MAISNGKTALSLYYNGPLTITVNLKKKKEKQINMDRTKTTDLVSQSQLWNVLLLWWKYVNISLAPIAQ